MPRIVLYFEKTTDDRLLRAVRRAAKAFGYQVEDDEDGLRVRKGSLFGSFLLGAFARYMNVTVSVHEAAGGEWSCEIGWETPWWTGIIGVGRSKAAAKEFADEIEEQVAESGGRFLDRDGP